MATDTTANAEELDSITTDAGAEAILRSNFADAEQDARILMQAASLLIEADSPEDVNLALDHNLKLWVAIKTVIQDGRSPLDDDLRSNLRSLAQYVATTTMDAGDGSIELSRLVSLARINMQIAEGLLRGEQNIQIGKRAYQIWEEEGRPEGRDVEHWLRAEAELQAATSSMRGDDAP